VSRFQDVFPGGDAPENLNTFFGFRLPKPAPADTNEDSIPGRLCWGQVGKLPEGKLVVGDSFETLDCDERHNEKSRKTDDIRIENPDDSEQWVEVRRANETTYNKIEKKVKAPTNSSTTVPEGIEDYSLNISEAFNPVDFEDTNKCKLTVKHNNGPTSA
jgi:hypothetical protein